MAYRLIKSGPTGPLLYMAVIYLKHPVHGSKVATMDAEAEYDEQNGWVRYDPTAIPLRDDKIVVNQLAPKKPAGKVAIKTEG